MPSDTVDRRLLADLHRAARKARAAADRRDVDTRPKGRRHGERDLARAVGEFWRAWNLLSDELKKKYEPLLAEMMALRLGVPGRRLTRASVD